MSPGANAIALRQFPGRRFNARAIGADRARLKMTLSGGRVRWSASAFRQGHWLDQLPHYIDVVYNLELDRWNSREQPQLNVRDLRPSD